MVGRRPEQARELGQQAPASAVGCTPGGWPGAQADLGRQGWRARPPVGRFLAVALAAGAWPLDLRLDLAARSMEPRGETRPTSPLALPPRPGRIAPAPPRPAALAACPPPPSPQATAPRPACRKRDAFPPSLVA